MGYLAFYPLTYIGLALVMRHRRGPISAGAWLDGAIAGLTAAALACATVLAPVLTISDHDVGRAAVNLAYPIGDLALLAVIVGALVVGGARDRVVWLLAASMIATGVADTAYLLRDSRDSYVPGGWIDGLWTVALLVAALAVPTRSHGRTRRAAPGHRVRVHRAVDPSPDASGEPQSWHLVAVPVLLVLADVALLDLRPQHAGGTAATALASAAVVAALGRLLLTVREVRHLADSRRQARTDELTGLMNRRGFYRAAAAELAADPARPRALLLLDLDKFKEVNDSLGHHMGDELLTLVGSRLRSELNPRDLIGRLGGDEFAILLIGVDEAVAAGAAVRLRAALDSPFTVDGIGLVIGVSTGIALGPRHGSDISVLLRSADVAMYQAKSARCGHRVFSIAGDAAREQRVQTVAELRVAVAEKQLVVHYQPKADPRTGRVTGVEALVRWQHPMRGLLLPAQFLGLVEESGLMAGITHAVLEISLDQAVVWATAGRALKIAVNLSASSLVDAHLADQVRGLLAARELPASVLQLEITEDFLLADRDRARHVLSELRAHGVTIAVDDFGTGYSSLAYLRELPIDELKVDQSFIFAMAGDPRAAALVESIVSLAHSLGLSMVAEGVENVAAWDALARWGCDEVQGYFLARPLPVADLERWLDGRAERPVDGQVERALDGRVDGVGGDDGVDGCAGERGRPVVRRVVADVVGVGAEHV